MPACESFLEEEPDEAPRRWPTSKATLVLGRRQRQANRYRGEARLKRRRARQQQFIEPRDPFGKAQQRPGIGGLALKHQETALLAR